MYKNFNFKLNYWYTVWFFDRCET